jgi:hypothetical protein
MPLAGAAFLALWNDIARAREAEYDRWHTFEHVPERVAVTGFLGARRYVDRARSVHRYFTLYEVDSLAVFDSAEYRDLLDHPTPASAAMRPDFANVVRATCATTRSSGSGIGAAIACAGVAPSSRDAEVDAALERALALERVSGGHVGRTTQAGPAPAFAGASPLAFDRLLLIEALDRDAADAALREAQRSVPAVAIAGVYDLAFVFPGADAAERLRHRRAEWR